MSTEAVETRVTGWVDLSIRPEWAGSGLSAYRIHKRLSGWGWEQRHEWRSADDSTFFDGWIRSAPRWIDGSAVV